MGSITKTGLIFVAEFESVGDCDSDSGSELTPAPLGEDLCLPALKYLQQCCSLLSTMWSMPACPVFNGASRSVLVLPFIYLFISD